MTTPDATLDDVLAFLDAFDADEAQQEQQKQLVEREKATDSSVGESAAKRRRLRTKYTTNLQRQKRAEISHLREQTEALETKLKRLKRGNRPSESESCEHEAREAIAKLEEAAEAELAARRRAEAVNRQLRGRLERLGKLHKDISRLVDKLQRQESSYDDESGLVVSGKSCSLSAAAASVAALAASVPTGCSIPHAKACEVLELQVKQVDRVFADSFLRPQSCWLETNVLENSTEIWSSATANCSVAAGADLLWCNPEEQMACSMVVTSEFVTDDGSHAFTKSLLPMRCRPWSDKDRCSSVEVTLHVEHYSRRVFDQLTGRAVLVTLALIRLPGKDREVLLRERFWKCFTPVPNSKTARSILQTSYRIEPGNDRDKNLSPAQASVMQALVRLTRRNHAMFQDWLLEA